MRVTIFSTGGKFCSVSNLYIVASSYSSSLVPRSHPPGEEKVLVTIWHPARPSDISCLACEMTNHSTVKALQCGPTWCSLILPLNVVNREVLSEPRACARIAAFSNGRVCSCKTSEEFGIRKIFPLPPTSGIYPHSAGQAARCLYQWLSVPWCDRHRGHLEGADFSNPQGCSPSYRWLDLNPESLGLLKV